METKFESEMPIWVTLLPTSKKKSKSIATPLWDSFYGVSNWGTGRGYTRIYNDEILCV